MCGRYSLHSNPDVIELQFHLASVPKLAPRYNIAPAADVLIVRRDGASIARWDPKLKNARAEGLAQRPAFRDAYLRRRCLVPANGFYEWKRTGAKQPWYIRPANDELFAFAALWEKRRDLESCSVITTDANPAVASIHDRMPVIIAREDYAGWLEGEEGLLRPAPQGALRCYPVSYSVNRAANDSPALIAPLASEIQKGIFD
jgi:putative SOS response-associated peptidase YedK